MDSPFFDFANPVNTRLSDLLVKNSLRNCVEDFQFRRRTALEAF